MKRVVIAGLLASVLAAGCGGDGGGDAAPAASKPASENTTAVDIKTFRYNPDPIEVKVGQKVTWTNADGTLHTVTAGTRSKPDAKTFDGQLEKNGTFSYTFEKPGTYAYFCTRHQGPGMTGKVVVS